MFEIDCPKDGPVDILLNPNSVLGYEYCHVAILLLTAPF